AHHHTASTGAASGIWATLIHTVGYFTVTTAMALLVYRKLGLAMLRRAWSNLDLIGFRIGRNWFCSVTSLKRLTPSGLRQRRAALRRHRALHWTGGTEHLRQWGHQALHEYLDPTGCR